MMFNNDFDKLDSYIREHTEPEPQLLKEITRQTHLKTMHPRMISGHVQGRVLSMFSKMIRPKNILEIGTFTGYSALSLAEGLSDNGKLITIDINDELEALTRGFFSKSEYKSKIEYIIGDAIDVINDLDVVFDLVFIDGDKRQYPEYYKKIFPKVSKHGYIIIDNILWNGKVIENVKHNDIYTLKVIEFNELVKNDDRVNSVIFPIRDGLTVLQKL